MLGRSSIGSGLIRAVFTLIILGLFMEALWFNGLSHDWTTIRVFHCILAISLLIALAMLNLFFRKNRELAETAHSGEIAEMRAIADKTALRYKNLLECAGDAIFVINADTGRLEEMNNRGSELFGYCWEEMDRLHGKDLVPVRDQHLYSEMVRRLARYGAADEVCITFKRKDGSRFLGEVSARLIDSGNGKVVQAIVRDITLKQQEEQEIRRHNRKLAILNGIIARVNQSDHLHKVLDVTLQEIMELFGAEGGIIHLKDEKGLNMVAQKNLDAPFMAAINEEEQLLDNTCRMAADRQCLALLREAGSGCRIAETGRENGWQSVAGIPLYSGKRLIGIMHILSRAEREFVPDDISFFMTMGNQLGIGIDHARMFEELNWKSEELLRSHRLLEKNSLQLEISQHRLEKNLALVEQANLELESLNIMKNHFIGMVSHEFKTPLTTILSGSEFLLANYASSEDKELQKLLAMIHAGGTRLNEIFTNLLKVAKLESNATSIAKTALLLKDILDYVQLQLEPALQDRGHRIVRNVTEDIPLFCGNREYVVEIFSQLLENAVKFTPDGGEIHISARIANRDSLTAKKDWLCRFNERFYEQIERKCYMEVEVRDSGIGIDPDEQLKIFDKFYEIGDIRHHSTGRHKFLGKGTGLGLAIVKGMVEAHSGMVWVESPVTGNVNNAGSAFFVLLPLEEDAGQATFPFI